MPNLPELVNVLYEPSLCCSVTARILYQFTMSMAEKSRLDMRQVPIKNGASDEYIITFHNLDGSAFGIYQFPHMACLIREFFGVIFPESLSTS